MELRRIGRNVLISSFVTLHEAKPNLYLRIKSNCMEKKNKTKQEKEKKFQESNNLFTENPINQNGPPF